MPVARKEELPELLKPLYGLYYSRYYWNRTIAEHLNRDLHMIPKFGDPALYLLYNKNALSGILFVYFYISVLSRDNDFLQLSEKSLQKLQIRESQFENIQLFGIHITQNMDGIVVHQNPFLYHSYKLLPDNSTFINFRSCHSKLSSVANTHHYISCAVSM